MPRPKPPEPLAPRYIRMTDKQWVVLNQLGGAEWLRGLLEKKAPMPKMYYKKLLEKNNVTDHTGL